MQHLKLSALAFLILSATVTSPVHSQEMVGPEITSVQNGQATVTTPAVPAGPPQENPIPPQVEGQPIAAQGGGYCYGGPHPAPGGGWEASAGNHTHDYPPFDLRLFSFHEGCYYFIGDPRDFGYNGTSYSYYGAHPILDSYGGGWCFMIGAHSHWWRPWSPYFTVVGPWYYWNGPYDPFFWSFWPYYSFYYRSYYPSYYAGGRYFRTWRAAPPITRVPPTGWRGSRSAAAGGWRGAPGAAASSPLHYGGAGGWRGAPGAGAGHAPPASGGWHGSPVPSTSAPLYNAPGGWHGAPSGGGGWHAPPAGGGGGWHAPPAGGGGGWRGAPSGSGGGWHGAPSGGGFRSTPSMGGGWHGGGGGFRGGGGFHGGGRR
jgi:hypothetical protein